MRYVEAFSIGNISVEVSNQKHRFQSPLKRLAKWGITNFIKGQIGSLLGTAFTALLPGVAISVALLTASIALYLALCYPGLESLAPVVLGLAVGVLL